MASNDNDPRMALIRELYAGKTLGEAAGLEKIQDGRGRHAGWIMPLPGERWWAVRGDDVRNFRTRKAAEQWVKTGVDGADKALLVVAGFGFLAFLLSMFTGS